MFQSGSKGDIGKKRVKSNFGWLPLIIAKFELTH